MVKSVWAVIPACDEEPRIAMAIDNAWAAGVTEVLVVENGSKDDTAAKSRSHDSLPRVISFPRALGPDIPRAVGAHVSLAHGADAVLFLDGDMTGPLGPELRRLLAALSQGADLALTNPFPRGLPGQGLAGEVTSFRLLLNRTLNWPHLGAAIPSHGPSALSRHFLTCVGCRALGHPPVALAIAAARSLSTVIGCTMDHDTMGGPGRDAQHALKMAETIIGDCCQAINVYLQCPPQRCWQGRHYDGYDSSRRWAWLEAWLKIELHAPPPPCR